MTKCWLEQEDTPLNNKRRKQISGCISTLEDILAEEDDSRSSMPENLENSERYKESENASENLQEALDALYNI